MRTGRRAVVLAGAGGGAALLAACGAGGTGTEPAGRPGANPPLYLEFWHNKAQPEGQDVTTIVTTYNATFAPTRVAEIFQGNGATLLTKLKAALAAATPPDVTYGFGSWMPSFAEQGALVLAEDQIKRLGGIKKEDFFPTLISAQTWKGKLQALPYGTGSKGYYVRPEIVKHLRSVRHAREANAVFSAGLKVCSGIPADILAAAMAQLERNGNGKA